MNSELELIAAKVIAKYIESCVERGNSMSMQEFLMAADGAEAMVLELMTVAAAEERKAIKKITEDEMNRRFDDEAIWACSNIMKSIDRRASEPQEK
jgi:enolase